MGQHRSENYGYLIGALVGASALFLFFLPANYPNRFLILSSLIYVIGAAFIGSLILDIVRRIRGKAFPSTYVMGLVTGFTLIFEAIGIAVVVQTGDVSRLLP